MDASASEWSSGCESGWTVYLNESSQSRNRYQTGPRSGRDHNKTNYEEYEEEEEDLSMVSDASSGPPNFRYEEEEEEVECFRKPGFPLMETLANKKKAKDPARGNHHRHSYLDDTASSPALSFPKYMDPSNNQLKRKSAHSKRQEPAEPRRR